MILAGDGGQHGVVKDNGEFGGDCGHRRDHHGKEHRFSRRTNPPKGRRGENADERKQSQPGLAPPVLIGNGAQSEFQAMAFKALVGVERLRLFDIDREASRRCARNLAGRGFDITLCGGPQEAVEGADIITTVTADKQYATILTDNMVGPGIHINAVGGDCPGKTELHRDILMRSSIFVEYPPQTRVEGEIQQLAADHPVTELWRVIAGVTSGRAARDEITLFDSVGFAVEDFSALRYMRVLLSRLPYFDKLDLLADPDDPRDLFGMLMRAQPQTA
jgi:ornithine cyclodeaminase